MVPTNSAPARRLLLAGLAALALAGCAAAPAPTAEPTAETARAASPASRPADGEPLTADVAHRFPDLLPGLLDVELTTPEPIVPFSTPRTIFLGEAPEGEIDVVTYLDADASTLPKDPLVLPPPDQPITEDYSEAVPPGTLLDRLAGLPFLEVTMESRAITIGGAPATAIDVRVPEFPAGAPPCAPELPPCAGVLVVGDFLYFVVGGQELRIAVVEHPAGRVMVLQSLQNASSQAVVDSTRFVGTGTA